MGNNFTCKVSVVFSWALSTFVSVLVESFGADGTAFIFNFALTPLRAACNGMNALAVPLLVFNFCGPSGELCMTGGGPARFGGPSKYGIDILI